MSDNNNLFGGKWRQIFSGYFEDPTPAIQVQTLPLEGPRSLGLRILLYLDVFLGKLLPPVHSF